MCAIVRRHPWVISVGNGTVALITAGLAAVSMCSTQSHGPVIDRATHSRLCADIGISTLVKVSSRSQLHNKPGVFAQFEILNEVLKPSGILLPYVSRCVIMVRALILLKFMRLAVLMAGYKVQMFSSVLIFSVALELCIE